MRFRLLTRELNKSVRWFSVFLYIKHVKYTGDRNVVDVCVCQNISMLTELPTLQKYYGALHGTSW